MPATGAKVTRLYSHLSMAAVQADGAALRQLLEVPEIAHVSGDMPVKRASEFAIPAISANLAHSQGVTGSGVGIAIIDSGVDFHRDVTRQGVSGATRIEAGYDFISNFPIRGGNDSCGHGTMVAGLAAGNADASTYQDWFRWTTRQFIGAAPRANILNLRILDRHGAGNVADAIAALNWCIANRERYKIRVANLSFGHPPVESYRTDPLCQATEAAWRAGIVVVCAAGNRGRAVPTDQNGGTQYGS
ncbi:MAG: S8 family serine peptidase, partial [Actinomycetota bacterium]